MSCAMEVSMKRSHMNRCGSATCGASSVKSAEKKPLGMQPGPLGAVRHLARRLVHIFVPLPVGQIAQVAGARRTDHADPGIEAP